MSRTTDQHIGRADMLPNVVRPQRQKGHQQAVASIHATCIQWLRRETGLHQRDGGWDERFLLAKMCQESLTQGFLGLEHICKEFCHDHAHAAAIVFPVGRKKRRRVTFQRRRVSRAGRGHDTGYECVVENVPRTDRCGELPQNNGRCLARWRNEHAMRAGRHMHLCVGDGHVSLQSIRDRRRPSFIERFP